MKDTIIYVCHREEARYAAEASAALGWFAFFAQCLLWVLTQEAPTSPPWFRAALVVGYALALFTSARDWRKARRERLAWVNRRHAAEDGDS